MDLVLEIADERVLDSLWASWMPLRIPIDQIAQNCSNCQIPTLTASYARAAATSVLDTVKSSSYNLQSETLTDFVTVSAWARDDWRRQFISLSLLTMVGIHLMYFSVATLSYRYLFDHRMMQHPRFIKGQIWMEIKSSLWAFPWLTLLMVPWFVGDVRGWSQCYDKIEDSPLGGGVWGWAYLAFSCAWFLFFTDMAIYFVHRWEHLPSVYKHIHKPHHRWVIPTPFASHAFHPLDGYAQALPYHIFTYTFPLHKKAFLILFTIVNLWTIFIHDSDMIVDHPLEKYINGPAHHTLHHMYFTCNYGQYFTGFDKLCNSYRHPAKEDDPLLLVLARQKAKEAKQSAQDAEIARRQEAELTLALAAVDGDSAKKTL